MPKSSLHFTVLTVFTLKMSIYFVANFIIFVKSENCKENFT